MIEVDTIWAKISLLKMQEVQDKNKVSSYCTYMIHQKSVKKIDSVHMIAYLHWRSLLGVA